MAYYLCENRSRTCKKLQNDKLDIFRAISKDTIANPKQIRIFTHGQSEIDKLGYELKVNSLSYYYLI